MPSIKFFDIGQFKCFSKKMFSRSVLLEIKEKGTIFWGRGSKTIGLQYPCPHTNGSETLFEDIIIQTTSESSS